jgi:hypothetical protein
VIVALFIARAASATPIAYSVNYDGLNFDLTGYIVVHDVGIFSPTEFDANVADYSITATSGAFTHTFTSANSTWGGLAFPGGPYDGVNVTIDATPGAITLSASSGGNFDTGNLFLVADVSTNGAVENLRLFQDQFGYRQPSPEHTVFDTVPTPFTLAVSEVQTVPEPASILLVGIGIAVIACRVRAPFSCSSHGTYS